MIRKLTLAVAISAALAPMSAHAFGLGGIRSSSGLNQPFRAEIDLLSVKADELDGVKVGMAPQSAYERAGVEFTYIHSKLRFEAIVAKGRPVIRVTTTEPVREPFLDFLIEVSWPKGQLVREYTVLLDPPVTSQRRPAPVAAPVVTAGRSSSPAPRAAPRGREPSPTGERLEYGPTRRNDTLWNIAEGLGIEGASTYQVMMALFRHNPDAFIKGNVNLLKTGKILRLPSREAALETSRRQARTQFSAQVAAWREDVAAPESAEPAEVTEEAAAAPRAEAPEAELRLVSAAPAAAEDAVTEAVPSETETSVPTERSEAPVSSLEDELLLAREEATIARTESEDLRGRIDELESQLVRMQRLLTLQNEQLAQLQEGAMATSEPESVAPTAAEPATEPDRREPQVAAEPPAPSAPVATSAAPVAPPAKPAAPPAKPVTEPPAVSSGGWMDVVKENGLVIGLGAAALALIGLLAGILTRRRKEEAGEFEESILATSPDTSTTTKFRDTSGQAATASSRETSLLSGFGDTDAETDTEFLGQTGRVDPVSEADVYMAYGRFDQAAELLLEALNRDPDQLDYKVKLAEAYSGGGDVAKFLELAQGMKSDGVELSDPSAWKKVVSLGWELDPQNPLFQDSRPAQPEGPVAEVVRPTSKVEPAPTDLGEQPRAEDMGMEFDLDFEKVDVPKPPLSPAAAGVDVPDDMDLDFDLEAREPETEDAADLAGAAGAPEEKAAGGNEETLELSIDALLEQHKPEPPKEPEPDEELVLEGLPEDEEPVLESDEGAYGNDVETKLDLAQAYLDMGDPEDAKNILEEVLAEGDQGQQRRAQELLQKIG